MWTRSCITKAPEALTPEPKAEPKATTPKPKAEPMSDFAKAVNMDAINKLSQKDLKRVLAILEKV